MNTHYYKRYRMEIDLAGQVFVPSPLPSGYDWQAWRPGLEERHAWAKQHSFRDELDATVFACLGDYMGCLRLMRDISRQDGFLPAATWLISHRAADTSREDCGTIQAVRVTDRLASIQNVGITPEHRGRGLGRALVSQCLAGCKAAGLQRVTLEVTATNTAAVSLYKNIGFQVTRTMYRGVDAVTAEV